jgi:hypothetical protein
MAGAILKQSTCAAALMLAAAGTAAAADLGGIPVFGKVTTRLQNDYALREGAKDYTSYGNNLYAEIEPEFVIKAAPNLSFEFGAKLEQIHSREVGDNQYFAHEGAYVSTLQGVYEVGGVTFNAGKFTAPFGFGPDDAPGLFGDTYLENYELAERLGVGAATEFQFKGAVKLGVAVSLFTRDRTTLAETAFTKRRTLRLADGGPGNTAGLSNWSAVVDVEDIRGLPDLHIKGSFLRQKAGENDAKGQRAWAIGAEWEKAFEAGFSVRPMAEFVHADGASGFNEATGGNGISEDILTAGIGFGYDRWNASFTRGRRYIGQAGPEGEDPASPVNDTFWQVGLGYAFVDGITVDTAYGYIEDGGAISRTIGARIKHSFEF